MTINSRGFNARKRDLIFDYAHVHGVDILAVEETLITDESTFKMFTSDWKGSRFCSPASGKSVGVAVFFSERFDGQLVSWKRDTEGRVISLLVSHGNCRFNVVCIYAPTQPSQRNSFLQTFHCFFFANANLIICGDFNCYDSNRDKFGGNPVLSKELPYIKLHFDLIDIWRSLHPRISQFTWFNSDLSGYLSRFQKLP